MSNGFKSGFLTTIGALAALLLVGFLLRGRR